MLPATLPEAGSASDGPAIRSRFEVVAGGQVLGPFELHVPGLHNVLNATAAVAIAAQLEIAPAAMVEGLKAFRGVDRRFQVKGCARGVTVVDDYGHHPTEIRATLRAAKECGYRRVHVIFQPHRYTRTRDLMAEFVQAFDDAATVEMLDIYAASEEPIPGVTAQALVAAIGREGVEYAASSTEAIERVVAQAEDGDVILTLGAGNVSQLAGVVLEKLQSSGR
jgi:UDP-N-acetylmuramate--alanine ligase